MLDSALEGPAVLHRWEPTAVPETGTTSLGCKMDGKRDGQVLPATHLSLKRVPWFWLTSEDPSSLIAASLLASDLADACAPIPPMPALSVSPIGLEVSCSSLDFVGMDTIPPSFHLELSENKGKAYTMMKVSIMAKSSFRIT